MEHLAKPNIAGTLAAMFDGGDLDVAHLRQVLEFVNASVTRSLLEDNLKKWSRELMTNRYNNHSNLNVQILSDVSFMQGGASGRAVWFG